MRSGRGAHGVAEHRALQNCCLPELSHPVMDVR